MNAEKGRIYEATLKRWLLIYRAQLELVKATKPPFKHLQDLLNKEECFVKERIERCEEKLECL